MVLTSQEVLNIISDEQQFIRHVCRQYEGQDPKIISIPRRSFTAVRLLNSSPVNLSLDSKVVLLGGVPMLWYNERRLGFWKFISNIGYRKLEKNAKKLENYGYNLMYKGNREWSSESGIEASKIAKTPDTWQNPVTENPKRKLNASHTVTGVPTANIHSDKNFNTNETDILPFKERKTFPLPPKLYNGYDSNESDGQGNLIYQTLLDDGQISKSFNFEDVINDSNSTSTGGSELNTKYSVVSPNHIESLTGYGTDGNFAGDHSSTKKNSYNRISPFKSGSNQNTSISSSSISTSLTSMDNYEDATSSLNVTTENLSVLPNIVDSPKGSPLLTSGRALKFDIQEKVPMRRSANEYCSVSSLESEEFPMVHLKSSALSKSTELMRILIPRPNNVDTIPKDGNKYRFKTARKRLNKLRRANGKFYKKVKRGMEDVSEFYERHHNHFIKGLRSGRIVFAEKVLVMQKTAVGRKEPLMHFTEAESIDTRVSERWKEFIMVLRSTNMPDRPLFIQFYKHQQIPQRLGKRFKFKINSMDFFLDKHCKIDFYNNLDKTISIQKPDDRYSKIVTEGGEPDWENLDPLAFFILRCRTLHTSSRLYELLRSHIGISSIPKELVLAVPDAGLSISLRFSKNIVNHLMERESVESTRLKLSILPRGYKVFQNPLMRYINVAVIEEMRKGETKNTLEAWEKSNTVLGCCFKRYDLLQWSSGGQNALIRNAVALHRTHVLEYRPYVQIIKQIPVSKSAKLVEPSPIEGFLIRLTNFYGNEKTTLNKFFLEPSFFFTMDNLLFYMKSHKANLAIPSDILLRTVNDETNVQKIKRHLGHIPGVFEHNPYPLDLSGHIDWLNGEIDDETYNKKDLMAFNSFSERVIQILKADGMVNMDEVDEIFAESTKTMEVNDEYELKRQVYKKSNALFWQFGDASADDTDYIINVKMTNGISLKILTPNKLVCDEWLTRLRALVKYWKAKSLLDSEKIKALKMKNFQNLKFEEEGCNVNEKTPKWLTDRGVTDASIYNANSLSASRPILHKGFLYQKPKKHATFTKYYIVLIPGFLVFYQNFCRSTTGFAKKVFNHVHYLTVPLEKCYIYSGATTELDLLKRDHTFDELNPGSHSLPRYYNDGWRSNEDESSRCFTLWFGNKRTIHTAKGKSYDAKNSSNDKSNVRRSSRKKNEIQKNPSLIHMTSKLGVSGKSMVFMARSRQERDQWVLSIYYELERVSRADVDPL